MKTKGIAHHVTPILEQKFEDLILQSQQDKLSHFQGKHPTLKEQCPDRNARYNTRLSVKHFEHHLSLSSIDGPS